jgi:hypothetical protein
MTAKRSTGPKTQQGKTQSRRNAWKHGLTATKITIAGEDASDFDAFRNELWDQFQPQPGIESVVVDRLAALSWRLRRLPAFEAAIINTASDSTLDAFLEYASDGPKPPVNPQKRLGRALGASRAGLELVVRYESALMHNFARTMQQLLVLQDRRREEEEANLTIEPLASPEDRNAA